MNIKKLDPKLFRKLSCLEELDVSNNIIEEISPLLSLESLKVLDVSSNKLKNVLFVEQLANLREFHCLGNSSLQVKMNHFLMCYKNAMCCVMSFHNFILKI